VVFGRTSVTALYGTCAGDEVWVYGCGPSLEAAPAPPPGTISIGTNRCPLRGRPTDYLLMVDLDVWNNVVAAVCEQRPVLVATEKLLQQIDCLRWGPREMPQGFPVRTFRYDLTVVPGKPEGACLHRGYITGYYATEIAVQMVRPGGRVVLAGMDLCVSPGEYPHPTFPKGVEAMINLCRNVTHDVTIELAGPSELKKIGLPEYSGLDNSLL
jgi:hypothetical protein